MRQFIFAILACALGAPAASATTVTAAAAPTFDSDGDSVPDFNDFSPGSYDPANTDADNDQIGDVIDPTPFSPGPWITIDFAIGGTYTVAPGAGVSINFTTVTPPVGNFGNIRLFLQPSTMPDAYAFEPMNTSGVFFIPANLVTIPGLWDLNTPGTYSVEAWGFGPGVFAGYKGGSATVIVTPEPASLTLLLPVIFLTCCRRRRTP
jgi:hypothetical protein